MRLTELFIEHQISIPLEEGPIKQGFLKGAKVGLVGPAIAIGMNANFKAPPVPPDTRYQDMFTAYRDAEGAKLSADQTRFKSNVEMLRSKIQLPLEEKQWLYSMMQQYKVKNLRDLAAKINADL